MPLSMSVVVYLACDPRWLSLSRAEQCFQAAIPIEIPERYLRVRLAWYDADALSNVYADFSLYQFTGLEVTHG
ncbi:MAG: hypothetical protein ABJN26_06305 [Stappiaceae bacterium]